MRLSKTLLFLLLTSLFSRQSAAWTALSDPPSRVNVNPLTFTVNPTNCPDGIEGMVAAAAEFWNRIPTSYLKMKLGGTNDYTPAQAWSRQSEGFVIVCDPAYSTTTGGNSRGITVNQMIDNVTSTAGILLNMDSTNAGSFKTDTTAGQIGTIAHEMGHVAGLGHSADSKSVMYVEAARDNNFEPAQDDHDALTALYPRNEASSEESGSPYGCATIDVTGGKGKPGSRAPAFAVCWLLIWLACRLLRPRENLKSPKPASPWR